MSISWYIKRFAAMSPEEILKRMVFSVKKKIWRNPAEKCRIFGNCNPDFKILKKTYRHNRNACSSVQVKELISEADKYLEHRWDFFGLHDIVEPQIDWHFDPSTKVHAPQIFSYDINHRKIEIAGDVKILWEKSRHHHITVLCAAYALTKDENYALEASAQILDWIDKNPCLIGINWTHPLELGIRLISWTWCERFMHESIHYNKVFGTGSPVWLSIGQHQELIAQSYSVGSSANNHLVGEMAGLLIASIAFPYYKKSKEWQNLAKHILEREIERQTFQSGIHKELAFEYQIFVMEFYLLSLHEATNAHMPFSDTFKELLKKKLNAIVQLTDYGKSMPRYGDGDNGMALQLQGRKQCRATWLLQLGSILLKIDCSNSKETALPVLLMGYDNSFETAKEIPLNENVSFADAGIYVLSNNRNTSGEMFVVADVGQLGYLSLAAHGHADALSFTLSSGGKELFTDPGTYNYYTDEKWRNYFRSTCCHNTVVIDGQNQSELQGKFLWSHKANTTLTEWSTNKCGAVLSAFHDGYRRTLGCIHNRKLNLAHNLLTVTDTLSGKKEHQVCLYFHCPPQCNVKQETINRLRVINDTVSAIVKFPGNLNISLHKGELHTGWFSPYFGVKVPSYTIIAEARCTFPIVLTTTIEVINEC
jgi:hypothetical protein